MRRSETHLALAFVAGALVPMPSLAAAPTDGERLHVEFRGGMPALVRTLGHGGRDTEESSAQAYARGVMRGEVAGSLVGYAVRPAPAGCDRPGLPCPARRAALPDDRADDLPARFEIEISDEPEARSVRRELRSAPVHSEGPGQWTIPPAGRSPYPPYGGGTVLMMATDGDQLMPGALAQADCFDAIGLCAVRVTYSRDLRVNFLTPATGEALARQVRAVDAVMRSVIRPGPLPGPGAGRAPGDASPSPAQPVYFPGLPLNRIRAMGGAPR